MKNNNHRSSTSSFSCSSRPSWFLLLCVLLVAYMPLSAAERPRLIVTTDIGGDPDDQQSMIRLMLYSNEFDIEGLIASAAGTPGELKEHAVKPELIEQIIEAYGQVQPNLLKHARGYPEAAALRTRIKRGNPRRGVANLGEDKDTQASNWIIQVVDRDDPRPVNVSIWGGSTDLAQALWRVRHDRPRKELEQFVARLRVHAISHQDDTGPWIIENFPQLFYVLSKAPGDADKRESVFRGMYLGGDESLTSLDWINEHVRQNHGPLGALYPAKTWTAPNPHSAMKEGDTPSWFYFLPHGLNDPEHPEWGGWGGRFQKAGPNLWIDATDAVDQPTPRKDQVSARATVWRWRQAFQADFQARMDWCVEAVAEANHPPEVVVNGDAGEGVVRISAKPGDGVVLRTHGTKDADSNDSFPAHRWFIYEEPGVAAQIVRISDPNTAVVNVPRSAKGKQVHVVVEVTDRGTPPLITFRRVVIDVQ